jgi:RHS repeat-associated protein
MVDSVGTTSWTYDAADQITALNTPQGNMTYTYYDDGRRNTMVEGVGTTTYNLDAAGRMTSLVNPYSETTSWTYDNANRTTRQTFNTGAYTAYGYDTRNRVTSLDHKNSSNASISSESYVYDDASNMTSKTVDSVTTTYGYDDIDQLTSESRSGYSASYTYDANGNRATKVLGGVTDTYAYSDQDELSTITRGGSTIKSYGYDNAGRTTSVVVGANTTILAYDYQGRLTQITYPNSSTNTFTYNAFNTRVGKVDSVATYTHKRDGVGVTAPVLSSGSAAYTPGISERISGTTKFTHQDFLGSTSRMLNSAQATTDTRKFDGFGNVLTSTGSSITPFGFAAGWGYQADSDSGLMLLGHRYYDSDTGRFLTRDPHKDSRNWYVYCASNPLARCDSTGLYSSLNSPSAAPIVAELVEEGLIGAGAGGAGSGGAAGAGGGGGLIKAILVFLGLATAEETSDDEILPEEEPAPPPEPEPEPVPVPTKPGKMQEQVEKGKAPPNVDRVDPAHKGVPGNKPHVHFEGTSRSLNNDGSWGHGGPAMDQLTNRVKDWLEGNNWGLPD